MAEQTDILKAPPPSLAGPQAAVYSILEDNGLSMSVEDIVNRGALKAGLTEMRVRNAINSGIDARRFHRRPNGYIQIATWEEWCKRCDEKGLNYEGKTKRKRRRPAKKAKKAAPETPRLADDAVDLRHDVAKLQKDFKTMMDVFYKAVEEEDEAPNKFFKVQSFTSGALFGGLCAIGGALVGLLLR